MNDVSSEPPTKKPSPSGTSTDFLGKADNWWSILILLFCFTAGCGIPILWVSRAFNVPGKIVVTLLVTIHTVAICWIFFAIMAWAWNQISAAL